MPASSRTEAPGRRAPVADHEAAARLAGEHNDLNRAKACRAIELKGRNMVIGAMPRMPTWPIRRWCTAIPALAALAHMIGDPAGARRGTIGGSCQQ